MAKKLPKLPELLERKISKTGQTRGADDDVIFQNRVSRNNTVLIPFHQWIRDENLRTLALENKFEKGYIVLISPKDYFNSENPTQFLYNNHLSLGDNCLVFYETRSDWDKYNPEKLKWTPANSREKPLGGNFVARVPATTALDSTRSKK